MKATLSDVKSCLCVIPTMRKLVLLFTLSGMLLLLSACTSGKKNAATTSQQEQSQTISLGMIPTMDGLPFIIADKQGIYDSLGLEVNIVYFNSGNDRDASLQTGQVDGAVTDYIGAALLQAHRTPLKIIMKNDGYFCFIVAKQSGINNREQLKTKNIAVSRNTVVEYATDLLLKQAGIAMNEVNKPEIGEIMLRLQMLHYGQVDASFLPDPQASIAMNGGNKSLISTRELGIHLTGTAFSEKALKEKAEPISRLVIGYNLAVEYMRMHPLKEWKQVLMEELGVPETLTGLIALPPYEQATRPAEADIASAIAWLKVQERISKTYQGLNLVDTTYTTTKPL